MAENRKKSILTTSWILFILFSYVIRSCVIASGETSSGSNDQALELLVAETNKIWRIHPQTNERRVLASGNGTIIDLDYHHSKKLVFWIDGSLVFSADLSDSGTTSTRVIIDQAAGAWEPLGLAVDIFSDRLYIADALGRKVDAFNLKGKNHVIIAAEDFERPSGLVLDPQAAMMFVADSDKIIRMNLDGTSRLPIVSKTVAMSISRLAIDVAGKMLFWWDDEMHAIESSTYIGESRRIVHHDKRLTTLTGLAYSDRSVYFLDGSGAIFTTAVEAPETKQTSSARVDRIFHDNAAAWSAMRALDPNSQTNKSNDDDARNRACEQGNNGGCQHACLASAGNGMSCKCYVDSLLGEDGRSCTPAEELLVYSHKEVIRGRGLEVGAEIALSLASPRSLSLAIACDYEARSLYFADAMNNTIYKGDLKTGQVEAIVGYEGSASVSLDSASRNLYYSDFAEGTLNVVSLGNYSHRKTLLDSLTEPRDVIVHTARGHVYFYDDAKIKRINTDGTKLTTIYTPIRHKSLRLAVDFADERLYWCLNDLERASKNSTIQHSSLDGRDLINLTTPHLRDVSALLVHGQWVYAIAAGYEKLLRLSKADGKRMTEIATLERQAFYALAVMRQPVKLEANPCASAKACEKLCFAVPRTKSRPGLARRCACPKGERLGVGKTICKPERTAKELLPRAHRCEDAWEFTCRNARCIPKTQVCDGVNDCLDRSDETGCVDTERNYFIGQRKT